MKRKNILPGLLLGLVFTGGPVSLGAQDYQPAGERIMTRWGESLDPDHVWQEYPRPQMRRPDWMNLNGLWDYALQPKTLPGPSVYQGKILVPFCIESALSGVGKNMQADERLWYRRTFVLPSGWEGRGVILHFEAVDWSAGIWVNGAWVGAHKGAYDRFSFDVTPFLKSSGQQEIVVSVDDPSSHGEQPRGKQQVPQGGIWYTPVSGIWQTVWLEALSPEAAIGELRIVPDVDRQEVRITPMPMQPQRKIFEVKYSILKQGEVVAESEGMLGETATIPLPEPRLWSPENPFLYGLTVSVVNPSWVQTDRVESYFGMRKISVEERDGIRVLHLNNRPLFQYGPLDQGWWPDGLHTPPSDEAMRYDLEMIKAMGFNMIRKHIKVEPDRWYFHCDRLGILVWQDMPEGMVVLPGGRDEGPLEIQRLPGENNQDLQRGSEAAARFEWEMRRMIDLHRNAPCIVMWVPFNEGWGQYATCRIARMVKELDPTRLVNAASGWSLHPCGDVLDIHSYEVEVQVPPLSVDRASVLGEYGGIGCPVEGHQWDPGMRNWGYQTYPTAEELLEQYRYKFGQVVDMYRNKGLSAAVYTQTTDVEGEVNGLMTYDRKVIKMPVDTLREMHSVLYE
jgi:hypothetical protein